MKYQYKTNDVCELFDISLDTLRYYEQQHLVQAQRGRNRYRQFTLKDFHHLNLIRDLRLLHVPVPAMKRYLKRISVSSTIDLLKEEEQLLSERLKELEALQSRVRRRILQFALSAAMQEQQIELITYSKRRCFLLHEHDIQEAPSKKKGKAVMHQKQILQSLDQFSIGRTLDITDLSDIHTGYLFVCDEACSHADLFLPAGTYLSMYYHGDRHQQQIALTHMLAACVENQLQIDHWVVAFTIIGEHDTKKKEELFTLLQIKVT